MIFFSLEFFISIPAGGIFKLFLLGSSSMTNEIKFAIPNKLSVGMDFQGVLLFVILGSCLVMMWSLIAYKNKLLKINESEDVEKLEKKKD